MEERELRTEVTYEVRVWGMDAGGKPFSRTAQVLSVSGSGATLAGFEPPPRVGDVIGVQYGSEKARFRVVWVGQAGTARHGHIELECVEEGRSIWGDLGTELQRKAQLEAAALGGSRMERRRHPRFRCDGGVQILTRESSYTVAARLADLSLGGCYAEIMSPYPVGTEVELEVQVAGRSLHASGVMRTSHPHFGNGIEFTSVAMASRMELEQVVSELAMREAMAVSPEAGSVTIPAPLEALLKLLEDKSVLTRQEYLEALRRVCAAPTTKT